MSILQSGAVWFQRNLGWSNSRQSWEERVGALVLVLGVLGVWWFGDRLSALQHVFVLSLLLVTAAVLLRRGWLKLFGPVLFYDMVRTARRGRYFLIRCLYAGLLLFILFVVYLNTFARGSQTHHEAARFAESFFEAFTWVQLLAVLVLTPAYVAGSVADEKDRKTLEFLLATDLRNREIVLSKLGSRLFNLTLFVLTGLPILSLLQFLGGVDPQLVWAIFAFTGLTAAGLAAFSMLNSVNFKRPRDAIAVTYLGAIAYMVLSALVFSALKSWPGNFNVPLWFGANPVTIEDVMTVFSHGNIIIVLFEIKVAGFIGRTATVVPDLLQSYAIFYGIVAIGCTALSVLRLRKVALRQAYGKTKKLSWSRRSAGRVPVGVLPMFWKEVNVEGGLRLNILACIILALLVVGTLAPGVLMTLFHVASPPNGFGQRPFGPEWDFFAREMNVWVRIAGTGVGCLMLLGIAVRASGSISGERDKQTWDGLMTTPLESSSILWAKWFGAILSIRMAWVWLGLIWFLGVLTGGLHIFALPLVLAAWFVFAAFAAMLGLWFSLVSRSSMRATVWTLTTAIALSIGHFLPWLCCMPLMVGVGGRGLEYVAKFQAGLTPPFIMGFLAFSGQEFVWDGGVRNELVEWLMFCLFGLFVWSVACVGFWAGILVPRFRALTNRGEPHGPEYRALPPRPRPRPRPERPPLPQRLPAPLENAILIEETWDSAQPEPKSAQKPPGDDWQERVRPE
jgi:ABC-type transport system involved in multi-copper enzyme maturation permease subunit